ncbi:sialidase family protein [Devriesea agamarum]|uniref:sialidase family protein n=1 Tax=Devriesea agamarum TaxID=472569 RepID=UPI00071D3232|nr:sialidase family protein [Devriesea agamarum]
MTMSHHGPHPSRRMLLSLGACAAIAPALTSWTQPAAAAQYAPLQPTAPVPISPKPIVMYPRVPAQQLSDAKPVDLAVRYSGMFPRYRIPAIATLSDGSVLAVYDGRPTMHDLPSNIAVLARRSRDEGRTWGPVEIIRKEAAPKGFGDPSILVDQTTNRIIVFYAASIKQGFFGSGTGTDPQDPNLLHPDISISDDGGKTWTHRRLTQQIREPEWAGMFASSGGGTQLKYGRFAGRLLQTYAVRYQGANWAMVAYSDDHGETWKHSQLVGPGADENKVVELSDGTVMLNSRAKPRRLIARSVDGGVTFTPFKADPALLDPANNGDIRRLYPDAAQGSDAAKILVFSNTEHELTRRNLAIKVSYDDGATWSGRLIVDEGSSGYSTMTVLPSGDIGMLYERSAYDAVSFLRIPLAKLKGPRTSLELVSGSAKAGTKSSLTVRVRNLSKTAIPAGTLEVVGIAGMKTVSIACPSIAAKANADLKVDVEFPAISQGKVPVRFVHNVPANGAESGTSTAYAEVTVDHNGVPVGGLIVEPMHDSTWIGGADGIVGDVIWPHIALRNCGNVTFSDVVVKDSNGRMARFDKIGPGQITLVRDAALHPTITAEDVAAGKWSTTYTVTGNAGGRGTMSFTAPLEIRLTPLTPASAAG